MIRTFIAAEPSEDIRKKIFEVGNILASNNECRLKIVSAEQMHITLKFLGDTPEQKIPKITEALENISAMPYIIKASGVNCFGRPARIIKAEIHDKGASAKLAEKIDNSLLKLGIAKENKKFSPHITIARVKEYSPSIMPILNNLRNCYFGECDISSVALKRSTLTPTGPIYNTISEVRL
ncbi:MAG TPA: RNA 2',3'-cyclic phosphodiesterase [Methanocorpusculum sp.]|nr:RNA 2',3'-cyclic phosphodiesterase [Methanocorpusculum sp.]